MICLFIIIKLWQTIYTDGSVDVTERIGMEVYSARGAERYLAHVSASTINNHCAHLAAS